MSSPKRFRASIDKYYRSQRIHPQRFACRNRRLCRSKAHKQVMTETKMSMVGSRYSTDFPRVVVVSLDPPGAGAHVPPSRRTTKFVSDSHERDDYTRDRPNVHWAMTQIIVCEILTYFGYSPQPRAAVVEESYAGRPIENVSAYFAHVNLAKCSMNNPRRRKAHAAVHSACGSAYLFDELGILRPQVLVTQGDIVNAMVGRELIGKAVSLAEIPTTHVATLKSRSVLWCPMRHPSYQLSAIRGAWHVYRKAIQSWAP